MISLRDIKKRIQSIDNISKITNAMKMVSAAKLRKAQDNLSFHNIYNQKIQDMILQTYLIMEEKINDILVLKPHKSNTNVHCIVVSSNKGLCGSFNNNIIKKAKLFINKFNKSNQNINFINVGKKSYASLESFDNVSTKNIEGAWTENMQSIAKNIAKESIQNYINEKIDSLWIINNKFKNSFSQEINIQQILPIKMSFQDSLNHNTNYICEPSADTFINELFPEYISSTIYQLFLESLASEHLTRMQAMESATKSAKDTHNHLKIDYNRIRQANITRELVEIISGAEAIK